MTLLTKPTDFRSTYFNKDAFTAITGYPTYSTIRRLEDEVLRCLKSVPSSLGGGKHGHMGLGVTPTNYQRFSATAYVRPVDPKEFIEPTETDPIARQNAKEEHAKKTQAFLEINLLESTILNMIQEAIDPTILRPLIDRITRCIESSIPEVFNYLYQAYGNLTDHFIVSERQRILQHQYNHANPLEDIFDMLANYNDMATAHGTPETDAQLMSMATIILMNANIFAHAIENWNQKQPHEKTWTRYQIHFIKAQKEYKKARATTTSASQGYTSPSANNIDPDPVLPPTEDSLELQQAVDQYFANAEAARATALASQAANAPSIADLMQQLQDLNNKINAQTEPPTTETKTKTSGKKKEKKPRKYCWTHGSCAHSSSECKNKATGHKDNATFTDMMGGSTKNCFWIPQHNA